MSASGLNAIEKKAAFSLATVFGLRMLGLFMILPVFAIYGPSIEGYSPVWLGLAIGAYGLTQALLQIPMGTLSDRLGRKPVILFGLLIFLIGSIVAANATNIYWIVAGRALQGMGAIASAVLALAADLSREEHRPKVMATIGMFIGLSFTVSMVLGPIVAESYGLSGLFWLTAILTSLAMLMVQFVVPNSISKAPRGDLVALPEQMKKLIKNGQLARLNVGVFVLHMVLTAIFVVMPTMFVEAGVSIDKHWQIYLPTLFGSFFLMVPFMIIGLKKEKEHKMMSSSILLLAVTLFILWQFSTSLGVLILAMVTFFTAFNYLEATMPSMLSRIAPAGVKGSAMGVFTSSQFFGAFSGGLLGGLILDEYGQESIFIVMSGICVAWLLYSLGMKQLKKSKSFSFAFTAIDEETTDEVAEKLVAMKGVVEATLVHSEAVAYIKLNDKEADIVAIKTLLQKRM